MRRSHDILIIGQYERLVSSRAELLRKYGYDVVAASDMDRAVDEFTSQEFRTIVLCQSLSTDQCKKLTEIIKCIAPGCVVVVLGHEVEEADVRLETLLDPQSFVNSIGIIVPRRPQATGMMAEENPAGD